MDELDPLGLQSDLVEQPLRRTEANVGPVVALSPAALTLRAGNDTAPPRSCLERVKEVLSVDLPAARNLRDEYVKAILFPLTRRSLSPLHTVVTDVNGNVRAEGLGHE